MNPQAFNPNPLFSFHSYEQPDDLNSSVDTEIVNSLEQMIVSPILEDDEDRHTTRVKIDLEFSKPELISLIFMLKQNSDQIIKRLSARR